MPSISKFCHIFCRGSGRRSSRTPRILSPNASLSILCISEAIWPSLKQILMQVHCSFTSIILAGRYDHKTSLTWRHKSAQKKHTLPRSRTPLGRMIYKGYISRYLAAHSCSTSGFRAVFQFRELLGSILYWCFPWNQNGAQQSLLGQYSHWANVTIS